MKNFYSVVIDGFSYHDVTEYRYKNVVEFIYKMIPEAFDNVAGYPDRYNVWGYLDNENYYPCNSYVAVDENNNELSDTEECRITFEKIKEIKEHEKLLEDWSDVTGTFPGN